MGEGPPDSKIFQASNQSMIAVAAPDKDGIAVYSIDSGHWAKYKVPPGVKATPVVGLNSNITAVIFAGPEIREVAAYSVTTGGWSTQRLKEPVADTLVPKIGENVAVYSTGRYTYAFSGQNCQWDVLELPQGEKAHPFIGVNDIVTVEHGDHLAVFNPKFGKWEDFDTTAEHSQ